MLQRDHEIYASRPLRQLADEQTRAMLPDLQRSVGTHALSLGVSAEDEPPALPMVGCWARMWISGENYCGDIRATASEPLPFVDEAFDVVLLRHALESVATPSALLGEAMRVLAPDGLLVVTGVHPISGWAPWFHWRARGQRTLQLPLQLGYRLQQLGVHVEWTRRVGRSWPDSTVSPATPFNPCGGGYVLLARKRCRKTTPLRLLPGRLQIPRESLSPGTRRSSIQRIQRNV